jgi:hypothetical protein
MRWCRNKEEEEEEEEEGHWLLVVNEWCERGLWCCGNGKWVFIVCDVLSIVIKLQ